MSRNHGLEDWLLMLFFILFNQGFDSEFSILRASCFSAYQPHALLLVFTNFHVFPYRKSSFLYYIFPFEKVIKLIIMVSFH